MHARSLARQGLFRNPDTIHREAVRSKYSQTCQPRWPEEAEGMEAVDGELDFTVHLVIISMAGADKIASWL